MKKYLVDKKDSSFLREYVVDGDVIRLFLANGGEKEIANSVDNIKYLDDLMIDQYYNYDNDSLVSFSGTNVAVSLGIAVGAGITFATDSVSNGMEFDNSVKMGLLVGTGAGVVSSYLAATSKAKEALSDYEKDSLFVENMDLFSLYLSSDNFCNCLSKRTRNKVLSFRDKGFSLNTMNEFSLSEIREIYFKISNYSNGDTFVDRDKVFVRK